MQYRQLLMKGIMRRPFRMFANVVASYRSSPIAPLPFELKFENTSLCNLKCTMCPHSEDIGLFRKKGSLKFDKFKYVFDQVKPFYLNLTGIGEPFLNPDIYDIVKHAKKHGSIVKFDTNATLLNDDKLRRIFETNIDVISVSLDGAHKETYENIRIGANFERVIANFKRMVEVRNEMKAKTKIHMFFVLQQSNIYELPEFVKLAQEIGVDYIEGTAVIPLGSNFNANRSLLGVDPEKIQQMVKETKELCKNTKMDVGLDNLLNFLENPTEKKTKDVDAPCYMPWYTPNVTWDGFMGPCCFLADKEYVFGNVFEEPFMKVWNGEAAQEFRKQLVEKRIGMCTTCGVDETFIQKKFDLFYKVPIIKKMTHRRPLAKN